MFPSEVSVGEYKTALADNHRTIENKGPASSLYNLVSGYLCTLFSEGHFCCTRAHNVCQGSSGRAFHRPDSLDPLGNHWRPHRCAICCSEGNRGPQRG